MLRLGFLAFTLTADSRELLTAFGREAPEVTVELRQYEWDDPSAGLLAGETDAGLVRPPFTGTDRLQLLDVTRDAVLAVVPEGHPLSKESGASVARIAEETFLEVDAVTDPVFAEAWYLRDQRRDRGRAVTSRAETVEEWLAEVSFGRGINLVPAGLARQYARPGLAFVPVTDAPPSRLALAWRRDDATPAVRALADLIARRKARPGKGS